MISDEAFFLKNETNNKNFDFGFRIGNSTENRSREVLKLFEIPNWECKLVSETLRSAGRRSRADKRNTHGIKQTPLVREVFDLRRL